MASYKNRDVPLVAFMGSYEERRLIDDIVRSDQVRFQTSRTFLPCIQFIPWHYCIFPSNDEEEFFTRSVQAQNASLAGSLFIQAQSDRLIAPVRNNRMYRG